MPEGIEHMLRLSAQETGAGNELHYRIRDITVDRPYAPDSIEKPERVTLQTYIWQAEGADALDPEGVKKPQMVCMGGLASEPVEIFTNIEANKNFAHNIIGIAHPNAPRSSIEPPESPFNDENSFANSGRAFLGVVEKLLAEKTLDPDRPIIFYGFSTGGAVATAAAAEFCRRRESSPDYAYKDLNISVVLGSPAGFLEMGGYEGEKREVGKIGVPYFIKELITDLAPKKYIQLLTTIGHDPKKILKALDDFHQITKWEKQMNPPGKQTNAHKNIKDIVSDVRNYFHQTIRPAFKKRRSDIIVADEWEQAHPNDKNWKDAANEQRAMALMNVMLAFLPEGHSVTDTIRDHFRRSFIVQPDHPYPALPTNSGIRARENVGHDSTLTDRAAIKNIPIHIFHPEGDAEVPMRKLLTEEDKHELNQLNENSRAERLGEMVRERWKELFTKEEQPNVHVHIIEKPSTHHLSTRHHAGELSMSILRNVMPDLYDKLTHDFTLYGSADASSTTSV